MRNTFLKVQLIGWEKKLCGSLSPIEKKKIFISSNCMYNNNKMLY